MKIARLAASLACVFLLAATAAPADAKTSTKKHKRHAAAQGDRVQARRPPPGDTRPEYIERDASKLPFGSSAWWEQMLRENRLSCCN